MPSPKLKPCPFCGGEAELLPMDFAGPNPPFRIACTKCDYKTVWMRADWKSSAVAAWNLRASDVKETGKN